MQPDIQISEPAISYLARISEQEGNASLRIGVSHPGTSLSQCFITFNSADQPEDHALEYEGFTLSYEKKLTQFIDE